MNVYRLSKITQHLSDSISVKEYRDLTNKVRSIRGEMTGLGITVAAENIHMANAKFSNYLKRCLKTKNQQLLNLVEFKLTKSNSPSDEVYILESND